MTYSEKKDVILNALIERQGLQYLVDAASKVLNNPLFIFDLSGKILAKSEWSDNPDVWNLLFPEGHLQFDNLVQVEKAGIYEHLMCHDEPIFGSFDFFPNRFLGCRIRDKGSTIGIATLLEMNPIENEDLELIIIVCKAILFEMLYYERTAMQTTPYFSLFRDILEKKISQEEMTERAQSIRLKLPKTMRFIAVGNKQFPGNLSTYFVRESLLASLPSCYCILYQDLLLLLIDEKYCNQPTFDTIKKCFSNADIWVGVSRPFSNLWELPTAYSQTQAVNQVRIKLHLKQDLIFYDDILLYHFFEESAKDHNLQSFCNPILKLMEEYDAKNDTCLLPSVEAYLENGRSIQKAAHALHIHKNTLYYRLKRAEELFSFSLENEDICFLLQFSFRLKRMI